VKNTQSIVLLWQAQRNRNKEKNKIKLEKEKYTQYNSNSNNNNKIFFFIFLLRKKQNEVFLQVGLLCKVIIKKSACNCFFFVCFFLNM
jgi:hypothetical protein